MTEITVGSQFATQKSGVVGIVREIVKNQNGTQRVRLEVNGSDRWTTVKQSANPEYDFKLLITL